MTPGDNCWHNTLCRKILKKLTCLKCLGIKVLEFVVVVTIHFLLQEARQEIHFFMRKNLKHEHL